MHRVQVKVAGIMCGVLKCVEICCELSVCEEKFMVPISWDNSFLSFRLMVNTPFFEVCSSSFGLDCSSVPQFFRRWMALT
jgi:hypothetical protein